MSQTGVDNCKGCKIPDDPRFYDIESEDYFTCSDCPCYRCIYLHNCDAQCAKEDLENDCP